MAKKVVVSRTAYLSIDDIIEFNNTRNQSDTYSTKFVKLLFRQFKLLAKFPYLGITTDHKNIYLLIWSRYYIYYAVRDEQIEILSVYHQKQNVR